MGSRLELHALLLSLLPNVYYQPPENVGMTYPCLVYHLTGMGTRHADNRAYTSYKKYTLTLITSDPDSDILATIIKTLDMSRFEATFIANNLYHTVFSIFY